MVSRTVLVQIHCFKMAEILVDGKKLSELKVTELKDELEKRDLSKKGVKTVLVNRLRACILKELEVCFICAL